MVTAGFAKDVEDVNQQPAVMNNATPNATDSGSFFRMNNIVNISPEVANISLTSKGNSPLMFVEI